MRKFNVVFAAFFLFLFVQVGFATVMNDSVPKVYTMSFDLKDTLRTPDNWTNCNGVDSATLKSDWVPVTGWGYFLYYKKLTKTADSIHVSLRLIAKDHNKNVLYYTLVDSLRGNAAPISIPIGSPAAGFYYDLKIYTTCENATDSAKVNFMAIGKRK